MAATVRIVTPLEQRSEALKRTWGVVVGIVGGCVIVTLVILAGVHHADRDRQTLESMQMWRNRAMLAESQVAEIVRTGDSGLLLATLETRDLGRAELRIRPVGR